MTQDKAHPTPPAEPMRKVPTNLAGFERCPHGVDTAVPCESCGANAAPVASNTTAEPAPIQPAGVEVERDAARYRWLRLNGVPQVVEPNGYGLGAATGSQLDEMIDHIIAIDQALAGASQGNRGKT